MSTSYASLRTVWRSPSPPQKCKLQRYAQDESYSETSLTPWLMLLFATYLIVLLIQINSRVSRILKLLSM